MIFKLSNPDVIQFIQQHIQEVPAELMLNKNKHNGLSMKKIAGQIASRKKEMS